MVTRVRDKGQITIPSNIRESLNISKDSILSVSKVGDAILLTAKPSIYETVAEKFSSAAEKEGLTLNTLLKDLKKVRYGK